MNKKTLRKGTTERLFIPENYGMIICHRCNGLGKCLNEANEITVCRVCGGFGAVKSIGEGPIEEN